LEKKKENNKREIQNKHGQERRSGKVKGGDGMPRMEDCKASSSGTQNPRMMPLIF